MAGAKGEIFAGVETVMEHFKVLWNRHLLYTAALKGYEEIIRDIEQNVP